MGVIKYILEDLRDHLKQMGLPLRDKFPYIRIITGSKFVECMTPGYIVMNKYWPMIVGPKAEKAALEILEIADPYGNYTNMNLDKNEKNLFGEPKINKFSYGIKRACEISFALGYKVKIKIKKRIEEVRFFKTPFILYKVVSVLITEIDGFQFELDFDSGTFMGPSFRFFAEEDKRPSNAEIKRVCVNLSISIQRLIENAKDRIENQVL